MILDWKALETHQIGTCYMGEPLGVAYVEVIISPIVMVLSSNLNIIWIKDDNNS